MILLLVPLVLVVLLWVIPGMFLGLGLKVVVLPILALVGGILALRLLYRYLDRRFNRP